MKLIEIPKRSFLFLQGPPGPFFAMLGDQLATECQFTAMIADPPAD